MVVADPGAADVTDGAAEPPFDPHEVNDNNAQAAPAANNVLMQRIQTDPAPLLALERDDDARPYR